MEIIMTMNDKPYILFEESDKNSSFPFRKITNIVYQIGYKVSKAIDITKQPLSLLDKIVKITEELKPLLKLESYTDRVIELSKEDLKEILSTLELYNKLFDNVRQSAKNINNTTQRMSDKEFLALFTGEDLERMKIDPRYYFSKKNVNLDFKDGKFTINLSD